MAAYISSLTSSSSSTQPVSPEVPTTNESATSDASEETSTNTPPPPPYQSESSSSSYPVQCGRHSSITPPPKYEDIRSNRRRRSPIGRHPHFSENITDISIQEANSAGAWDCPEWPRAVVHESYDTHGREANNEEHTHEADRSSQRASAFGRRIKGMWARLVDGVVLWWEHRKQTAEEDWMG
ncbi:hypothetical protein NA57DRAFT_78311 [Rhizodiscina lignyota]|uniref:Uncharacterized protein n=1 Tax=Rhizodiscina lignyota TaxID=1504668 RepID=A0A9P4M4E5_9PEZI|nr:hypothetical protein NA57DRAFT_78311 [Rhizodiscina lignyota]